MTHSTQSACRAVDEYGGVKALENLARDLGILSFYEPEQGWVSRRMFGEWPRQSFTGCRPVAVHPAGENSVGIRWRFIGVHATTGQVQAVADKILHALAMRRMVSLERLPGTREALMILSNDNPVSYPKTDKRYPQLKSPIIFHSDTIGRALRVDLQNHRVHVENSR